MFIRVNIKEKLDLSKIGRKFEALSSGETRQSRFIGTRINSFSINLLGPLRIGTNSGVTS